MSIEERRAREKQARIEAIKESAWRVFLRDGFQNAKIAEVAKDCSLGLATLYYYFKDKRQIVYSLMLDYKRESHEELFAAVEGRITYREFVSVYVNSALKNLEHFRFFVLADSYYNFHHEYDLSDPVIEEYDRVTREQGEFILHCFTVGLDTDRSGKMRVVISMILGFLRRYVLLPERSWPHTELETAQMIEDLLEQVHLLLTEMGINLESTVPLPSEP